MSDNTSFSHLISNILITGVCSSQGARAIQKYWESSGDIQSAALFACISFHSQNLPPTLSTISMDMAQAMSSWIDGYRDLLDQWSMFTVRAKFDICYYRLLTPSLKQQQQQQPFTAAASSTLYNAKHNQQQYHSSSFRGGGGSGEGEGWKESFFKPQLYIKCNFCGVTIGERDSTTITTTTAAIAAALGVVEKQSSGGKLAGSVVSSNGSGGSSVLLSRKLHNGACPCCKKPLPRCSICLSHIGSGGGGGAINSNTNSNTNPSSLSRFNAWTCWCQKCKHGGHTGHLFEWFQNHLYCPVADCLCSCNV